MNVMAISEAASQEPKRGRPRTFSEETVAGIRAIYPEVRSHRQLVSKCYELIAIRALGVDRERGTLLEPFACLMPTTSPKTSILAELGRLVDPDLIRTMATAVVSADWARTATVKEIAKRLMELRLS